MVSRQRKQSRRSLAIEILCVLLIMGTGIATPNAHAQQKTGASKPGWVRSFDDVSIDRIKPDDLPATSAPGSMIGLRISSKDLPRHASQEDLKQLVDRTNARVLRIVAVQTPPRPYRQVPMLFFGHAVWVTPPAAPVADAKTDDPSGARAPKTKSDDATPKNAAPAAPVLLSSLDWLAKADKVYALPQSFIFDEDAKKPSKLLVKADTAGAGFQAARRSLEQMTAGTGGEKWLKEHKDKLIELTPRNPDRHRNLVAMVSDDARLAAPKSAFSLFDNSTQVLFKLYGFSPYAGLFLSRAMIMPKHPENPALTFYWQTNYAAILGAPLLGEDGNLVAINTLQHPDEPEIYLSIPTPAIASYLQQHRESKDLEDETKE